MAERTAATKASASRVIRSKIAKHHPDAVLIAAADQVRPMLAETVKLESEFHRLRKLSTSIIERQIGDRPDWTIDMSMAKAYDKKRRKIVIETGFHAASQKLDRNHKEIWRILGPLRKRPARTLEGAAAKTILFDLELIDPDELVHEIAVLFYGVDLVRGRIDVKEPASA
ncbi:hypothetical protein [Methylobacterium sp. Leaf465]|uniref:hypothetical protein n=1 Tax=Methylobacterium sp. Leaf465 TaxID=1736385 RepID=UPI0012E33585|nr:hypothetical protein [Methylobacterium sp. Leaf465]